MKRVLVTLALVAAIAAIPPQAKSDPPQPKWVVPVMRCLYVVVIVVAGGVIIHCVKKWCDGAISNHNWQITNEVDSLLPPLISSSSGEGTSTVQYCEGLGTAWVNGQSINLVQKDGMVIGILMDESGKPIATNSATAISDGQTVVLDFSKLVPAITNSTKPVRFYRLVN